MSAVKTPEEEMEKLLKEARSGFKLPGAVPVSPSSASSTSAASSPTNSRTSKSSGPVDQTPEPTLQDLYRRRKTAKPGAPRQKKPHPASHSNSTSPESGSSSRSFFPSFMPPATPPPPECFIPLSKRFPPPPPRKPTLAQAYETSRKKQPASKIPQDHLSKKFRPIRERYPHTEFVYPREEAYEKTVTSHRTYERETKHGKKHHLSHAQPFANKHLFNQEKPHFIDLRKKPRIKTKKPTRTTVHVDLSDF